MYGAKVSIERGRMGGLEEPRPWTGVTKCGQQWKAMVGESERDEREKQKSKDEDCPGKGVKRARLTHVNQSTASNCRLPASRPPSNSSIPCMMHKFRLGLVRSTLFRICIHDAREPRRQRWPIRPLARGICSLHRGMRIHELELLISL